MIDTSALLVIALAAAVGGLLLLGFVLMARDTIRQRGRWGICLRAPHCLQCGAPMPMVRKPANWRQALWGGGTCLQCGFELDKFGYPVEPQPFPAKWSAVLEDGRRPEKDEKRDPRLSKRSNDVRRGGDYRD